MSAPQHPSEILVNGVAWKVVESQLPKDSAEFARIDYHTMTITVHTGFGEPLRQDSSCHESIHAVLFAHGISRQFDNDLEIEENFVEVFAPAWWRFMRDNPDLVAYWMAKYENLHNGEA